MCFYSEQYLEIAVRAGRFRPEAHSMIIDGIRHVLRTYAKGCAMEAL